MQEIINKLKEIEEFYSKAREQTQDLKLQLLLKQLAAEKIKHRKDLSRHAQGDIRVDPSLGLATSLTSALQYFRLVTARQDKELISLCEKQERQSYSLMTDYLGKEDASPIFKRAVSDIRDLTEKTIHFLVEENQTVNIEH